MRFKHGSGNTGSKERQSTPIKGSIYPSPKEDTTAWWSRTVYDNSYKQPRSESPQTYTDLQPNGDQRWKPVYASRQKVNKGNEKKRGKNKWEKDFCTVVALVRRRDGFSMTIMNSDMFRYVPTCSDIFRPVAPSEFAVPFP